MRVNEFTAQFKQRLSAKGDTKYNHLSDSDFIQVVTKINPNLLKKIDRQDLAQTLKQGQSEQVSRARQEQFKASSMYNRFMSGTGQSMTDVFMGIKQMFGGNTNGYQDTKQAYMEASKGDLAAGLGEITGAIAATAPIPAMTGAKIAAKVGHTIGRAAVGAGAAALTGLGYGTAEHVDEGETRARNAAMGTLFGVGAAGVGQLGKYMGAKAYNAVKEKMKTAPVQEIYDLAKQYGINLRASDITGEGKFGDKALERIPGAGMASQAKKTAGQVQGAIKTEREKITSGWEDEIQASLERKAKAGKAQAKENYTRVESLSGGARVEPINTISKVDNIINKEFRSDVPTEESTVKWFTDLQTNLSTGKKNYAGLRSTREQLGKEAKKYAVSDPNRQRLILEIRSELDKDMDDSIMAQVESMTKRKGAAVAKSIEGQTYLEGGESKKILMGKDKLDVRKAMKDEAAKQIEKGKELKSAYEIAKKQYREEVVPYKDRKIMNDLKTDAPDEIYDKYIKAGKGDKAANFYKLLDDDGKKALKNGFLENAFKGATDDFNSPDAFYSPKKLSNYFYKMSAAKNKIFTDEELKHMNGFAKLMKHSERYGQIHESPSNGMAAIPFILGSGLTGGAMTNPAATAATAGGGLILSNLATFMKTHGKRLTLASGEIGSKELEKNINKILSQMPKLTAVTSSKLEE